MSRATTAKILKSWKLELEERQREFRYAWKLVEQARARVMELEKQQLRERRAEKGKVGHAK